MVFLPLVFAVLSKNFGCICIGISIFALVEIGVQWELVFLLVLSVIVCVLSALMVVSEQKRIKHRLHKRECGGNV